MSKQIEALKLALEALEHEADTGNDDAYKLERDAIKEALAQPEPWEKFCDSNCVWTDHHPDCKMAQRKPLSDEKIAETLTGYRLSDAIDITRAIEAAHGIKG